MPCGPLTFKEASLSCKPEALNLEPYKHLQGCGGGSGPCKPWPLREWPRRRREVRAFFGTRAEGLRLKGLAIGA